MAILEAVISQSYQGQQVINRYHYVSSGTPAAVSLSFALLYAMGYLSSRVVGGAFPAGTIAGAVQDIQHNSLTYVSSVARDLYSVTDFYENPFVVPVSGDQPGSAATPVLAYGFQSNRVRLDVRRGSKRYAGVLEEAMEAGGTIVSGYFTEMGEVADLLSDTLTYDDEGNTITFVPAVLSFEMYTTPPAPKAYRKYETEAEQLMHTAQGVLYAPQPRVRTQVSRQYGRGV